MENIFKKLKERWKVKGPWQVIIILIIFSVSGMSVLYIRNFTYHLLGFNAQTPLWEEALVWLFLGIPSYQLLFLLYGAILGQFEFVWRFQKEKLQQLKKLITKFWSMM